MTTTKDAKHVFDWHEENGKNRGRGTFLSWALLNFTGFTAVGKEKFEELSEATDRFTRVELGITVNGIEVGAKTFMEALDQAMDWAVEREAAKLIEDMPRLHQLHEAVADFERDFKERVRQLAHEAGIELREDDW